MTHKEQLESLRSQINNIDGEILKMFEKRMGISGEIAGVKIASNSAIFDPKREDAVLGAARSAVSPDNAAGAAALMRTLMALSKMKQARLTRMSDGVDIPAPAAPKTQNVKVAYQGLPGAWSEQAAAALYPNVRDDGNACTFTNLDYFEDVFAAVKNGEADYGVLPIENSRTGAIGEVYDLLRKNGCYIVRQVWVTVAQCLLAREGAELSGIREVFSHPEGFAQCRRFLKNRNLELTACRNTAYAARLAADKNDDKFAAIGSRRAAAVNQLTIIAPDIMDDPHNRTRFIAIAASPEYDAGCDNTAITFSTAHRSGALCAVLQSLSGINLSRIESRPVTGSGEKYRFFADLSANILDESVVNALKQAAAQCDYFEVLGCYPTVIE